VKSDVWKKSQAFIGYRRVPRSVKTAESEGNKGLAGTWAGVLSARNVGKSYVEKPLLVRKNISKRRIREVAVRYNRLSMDLRI
jgi:hypothetical protein